MVEDLLIKANVNCVKVKVKLKMFMLTKFKLFEKYEDVDPYGEENWDDDKPIIVGSLMVSEELGRHNWYEAIDLCENYKGEGFNDWRLPTKEELNELYKYHKKFGGFVDHYYWSSSEYSATIAWSQCFANGDQFGTSKNYSYYVRAVRSF